MSKPKIPYRMPDSTNGKIRFLCELMQVPPIFSDVPEESAYTVLRDTVLYHHLDRLDRRKVMMSINALSAR